MDLISVKGVSKTFASGKKALDNVSLGIPEGSVYGLLGPNGAGKTTLIRIINMITRADCGEVYFDNRPIRPQDLVQMGYMPEERGLYKKMKVGEQALFFARLHGMNRHDAIVALREWFERFGIEEWWNKRVEDLSKGMAQKVQFITTVAHRPRLLIFDEPFSGFDPINANLLKEEILRLRDNGSTVIFSTHNMSSVEEICDNITLINKSRNILSGNVEDIRREYGRGLFSLRFRGEASALDLRLAPLCEIISREQNAAGCTLQLKIHEGVRLKELIHTANESVELLAFDNILPSMNNIFINTVKQWGEENDEHPSK